MSPTEALRAAAARRPASGLAGLLLAVPLTGAALPETAPVPDPSAPPATAGQPTQSSAEPAVPPDEATPVPECAAASRVYEGRPPWFQQLLQPEPVLALADGTGVAVAVLSSGVDGGNGQLAGAVSPGLDLLSPADGPADTDCDGRGTLVAGLIAARPREGTSIRGLAPGATILPARVVQSVVGAGGQPSDAGGDAETLAAGIRWAVDSGATVVAVTVTASEDSPLLRDAVARATDAGAVVVAGGPATDGGGAERYPSAYPEVLAVAGIQPDGTLVEASERGAHVDVVAPAGGIVGTAAVARPGALGHSAELDDPAAATALAAGTVALVRQSRPELAASEVVELVRVTAMPGFARDDLDPGVGVVDPYAALATTPLDGRLPVGVSLATPVPAPEETGPLASRALAAGGIAGVVLLLAAVTVATARSRVRIRRPAAPDRSGP